MVGKYQGFRRIDDRKMIADEHARNPGALQVANWYLPLSLPKTRFVRTGVLGGLHHRYCRI
jgi:hypothetical protein